MSRSRARLLLPVLMLILAVVLVWQLVGRSAIPTSLDGTVQSISIKDEHPGTRNVYFVRIGSTTRQVDPATGRHLAVGDRVSKDSWSRDMRVNGEAVRLKLSREAKASLWFAPLLVAVSAVLAVGGRRRRN